MLRLTRHQKNRASGQAPAKSPKLALLNNIFNVSVHRTDLLISIGMSVRTDKLTNFCSKSGDSKQVNQNHKAQSGT